MKGKGRRKGKKRNRKVCEVRPGYYYLCRDPGCKVLSRKVSVLGRNNGFGGRGRVWGEKGNRGRR